MEKTIQPKGLLQPGYFGHSTNYAANHSWLSWQSLTACAPFSYSIHYADGTTKPFGQSTAAGDVKARDEQIDLFYQQNGGRGISFVGDLVR